MSQKQPSTFSKKYLIWFSICLVAGFYFRHWANTGQGQFKRLNQIFG